jgi:hypothetical protein
MDALLSIEVMLHHASKVNIKQLCCFKIEGITPAYASKG